MKAQSDLANSIEYKSALLLELWTEIRELDDEKVLRAKKVILHDLLAQNHDEVEKTVCKNAENVKLDELADECSNENCPKCPDLDCSSDGQEFQIDHSSIKEKAFEYLVTNFKNVNYEKVEKINFKDEQFDQECVLKHVPFTLFSVRRAQCASNNDHLGYFVAKIPSRPNFGAYSVSYFQFQNLICLSNTF